jgi:small subunit ribosomal protein S20
MPNIKSAKRRMRLSRVQNARNRAKRSRIRTAMKKVHQADSVDAAAAAMREAQVLLDRAACSRLLHPNTAARMKSGLARHVNSLA